MCSCCLDVRQSQLGKISYALVQVSRPLLSLESLDINCASMISQQAVLLQGSEACVKALVCPESQIQFVSNGVLGLLNISEVIAFRHELRQNITCTMYAIHSNIKSKKQ